MKNEKILISLITLSLSLSLIPQFSLAQGNAVVRTSERSLLASLYCATLGAWLASPRCIEENNTILPANTVVNQTFNSTTTQTTNTPINSIPPTPRTPSNSSTPSNITDIVNSAVQKALSSYSTNSNTVSSNDFVTRDFLSRQIGAMGDSTGRSVSSVSSSITNSGTLTNPTISGATITGSTFAGSTGIFTDANINKLISSPGISSVQEVAKITLNNTQGIWGADRISVINNKLYFANNETGNIDVYDVTNSANPTLLSSIASYGNPIALTAQGNYLYVENFASSSIAANLQIFDIRNSGAITSISTTTGSGGTYQGQIIAYQNFVVILGDQAMRVYDVTNPSIPVLKFYTSSGYPHNVVASNGYLYEAISCASGIIVSDMRNGNFQYRISEYLFPGAGCGITKYYSDYIQVVAGRYIYSKGLTDENLYIVDISNPLIPTPVNTVSISSGSNGNYPRSMISSGNRFYLNDLVFDTSSPASPVFLGTLLDDYYSLTPSDMGGQNGNSAYLVGNNLYISYSANGSNPTYLSILDLGGINTATLSTGSLLANNVLISGDLEIAGTLNAGFLNVSTGIRNNGTLSSILNSTSSLVFDNSGRVGIGTTSPYAKLSVAGNGSFDDFVRSSYFTATSTTATSTFVGGLTVGNNAAFVVNQAATANSLYVAANGKVGIGTASPSSSYSLNVNGSVSVNGEIANPTSELKLRGQSGVGNGQLGVSDTINFYVAPIRLAANTTIMPYAKNNSDVLTISASTPGNDTGAGILSLKSGSANPSSTVNVDGGDLKLIGGTPVLTGHYGNILLNAGNSGFVGIGTSTPYAKLSVEGSSVLGNSALAGYFTATSTTATSTFAGNINVGGNINLTGTLLHNNGPFIASQWTTNGSDVYYNTGNVGIGINAPRNKLEIHGNQGNPVDTGTIQNSIARIGVLNGQMLEIGASSNAPYGIWMQADYYGGLSTHYPIVFQPNGGNVGIGTTTPWRTLSVTGTVAVSGLTANSGSNYAVCINNTTKELTADVGGACNPSSERFKNNIQPLAVSATDVISLLKPSTFIYNNADTSNATTSTKYGLIAEQVSSIDPHLATYEEDGITPHGLDTSAILSVLVKAVQEISANLKNLIVETITATVGNFKQVNTVKVKVSNGIEMIDKMTGQTYCITVSGGQFDKQIGDCGNATTTSVQTSFNTNTNISTEILPTITTSPTPTSTSTPLPTETPTTTPMITETSNITPESTPMQTPTPTLTETPDVTPIDTVSPPSVADETPIPPPTQESSSDTNQ